LRLKEKEHMVSFDAEAPDPFRLFLRSLAANTLALLVSILVFGFVTALVVFLQRTGFNLFSLTWLGVVPIGACLLGLLMASGYFAASLALNVKPTWVTGLTMGLLAALTQAAIYSSQYVLANMAGDPHNLNIHDWLKFVDETIRHTRFGVTIYGYE